jgi:CHAT domain-containing protein/tetratricopeptide (TPR) repeat protein
MFLAREGGSYLLQVRLAHDIPATGHYEIVLEELRPANPEDVARIQAQRDFSDGEKGRNEGSEKSLRKALEAYGRALPVLRGLGDRPGEALALNRIGEVYSSLSESTKALEYLNQALTVWLAADDLRGQAQTLDDLGGAYYNLGEVGKAIDTLSKALTAAQGAKDRGAESEIYNDLGVVYADIDEYQALDYNNQALTLRRATGNRRGEAITLANIGHTYYALGDEERALAYFNQAIPIMRVLGDRYDEAATLNNMAAAHSVLGDKQKALDLYARALALQTVVGDRQGQAVTLSNMGNVYKALGETRRALERSQQALSLAEAVGDLSEQAISLTRIANLHAEAGERQQALPLYNRALSLSRSAKDRRWEAMVLDDMGHIEAELGHSQKALERYEQALQLQQAVGYPGEQAETLEDIGRTYDRLGQKEKASGYYSQALELAQSVGDRFRQARILLDIASVERDRGQSLEALKTIERALALVESLRAEIVSYDFRTSFFAERQKTYEFYVDSLMQLHKMYPADGYCARALEAAERQKARSLLDALGEAHADIREGADLHLLERERSLQRLIDGKSYRRIQLLDKKGTEHQAAALQKDLDALLVQYQEVETQIRQGSPRYAALTQPEILKAEQIQTLAGDSQTLLLEYALGDERSYLWAITRDSLNGYELAGRAQIDACARRVYEVLTTGNYKANGNYEEKRGLAEAEGAYPKAAATLSQMVLGPAANLLAGKRLVIVADGPLQYVPFGALPAPNVKRVGKTEGNGGTEVRNPLVVSHEIVNVPSFATLALLRKEVAGRREAPKLVAVLADPVFDAEDSRVLRTNTHTGQGAATRGEAEPEAAAGPSDSLAEDSLTRSAAEVGLTREGLRLRRLFFTRREADSILEQVPDGAGAKFLDFRANRTTAKSPDLANYRVVHFATHGWLDSEHPELSGLVLSMVDEHGKPQNGFLELQDIYNLKLHADVVVLSACQTGLGKDIKGEGLVGLTRGFMYAGAPRVMASLWSVEDVATSELMKTLYQNMFKTGFTPAAALRSAQVEMWRSKRWSAPYFWASFVFQGEWR